MRESIDNNKTSTGNYTPQSQRKQLVDRFGREVDYLRISVTDRCDLRCVYCMSENMTFVPRSRLLTLEEIVTIGRNFVELGVNKIRITGGEPLTRNNIMQVFHELGKLPGLDELTLTTNGTQLARYATELREAGVTRINISLDTLDEKRFTAITRVGQLGKVLDGIEAALQAGFKKIKLNSVIMKHKNHDEIHELVRFAQQREMDISFIEEMPLGDSGTHDRAYAFYSSDEILADLAQHYQLTPTTEKTGGPSRYYRIPDSPARIGFISPHSHNFCEQCNRVRMTAEGRLLLCLGQEHSMDLKQVVRSHPGDDSTLKRSILDAMQIKPRGHDFNLRGIPVVARHMNTTGG